MFKKAGVLCAVGVWLCALSSARVQSAVLYETRFEAIEGFNIDFDLAGQGGWMVEGTGGNGLVDDYFEGFGQQAYIGFVQPAQGSATSVWRPVNFTPVPTGSSIVHFSVKMQVVPSEQGGDDDFRWSVYNRDGRRLFGISFETATQEIWFQNEDLTFHSTGWSFDFEGVYDLHIWMDFARNSWTALLNDVVLLNAQPITTVTGTARNLGDVDAVWFVNNLNNPGDNFMVFDDYRITSENLKAIPPILETIGMNSEGYFQFYVFGQPNVPYDIEVTEDFQNWFPVSDDPYVDADGNFVFEDNFAPLYTKGFYRLVERLP
jgi:hypothetical protein